MLRATVSAARRPVSTSFLRSRWLSTSNESVAVPEVETLLLNGIQSIGYNLDDAIVMKDAMMWAQLRDNNQGIIKLTSGGLAKSGEAEPSVEFDSPTGARVNGNQAMSMVVLDKAVRLAIDKAQRSNVGIVGTWNTSQSCGALGFYTEKIANAGLIGLVFATSCAQNIPSPASTRQASLMRGYAPHAPHTPHTQDAPVERCEDFCDAFFSERHCEVRPRDEMR